MLFINTIINFTIAIIKHSLNGFRNVDLDTYIKRIDVCNKCEHRNKNICSICGCYISKKAWWESEKCPKKKWDT